MITYIIIAIITFGFTTVLTIAGLGAAFILIPVLLAMGVPLLTAMSTALLLNTISMAIASVSYMKEKLVVFQTAIPMVIAVSLFSPLGASVAKHLPDNILKILFICFLIFAASMIMFFKPKQKRTQENPTEETAGLNDKKSIKKTLCYGVIIGIFAGFLGGLLGVGGGNIIIPFLLFLGFDAKKAAATTAFVVIFSSFSGFLTHVSLGTINIWILFFCAIGSISGAILGAYLMKRKLSTKQVKGAIGIVLYIVAVKMIYDLVASTFLA